MNGQVIADTGIAIIALVFYCVGAFTDGRVSSFALIWAGMCTGYLVTTYMVDEEVTE
jgi:hypothetical protein